MKKVVSLSDVHLEHDQPQHSSYLLAKKFIKTFKPDLLVLNGDILDFSYLSSYNESKAQLKEGKRLILDIDMLKKELDFFHKYASELIYLEGNHENRLMRKIEEVPEFEHILEMKTLIQGENFILERQQPTRILNSHLWIMHGKYLTKYYSEQTLRQYMLSIIVGHTHKIQSYTMRTYDRELGCWGQGCLTDRNPYYLAGKMNQWQNGFVVAYVDETTKNFSVNNINIVDNSFFFEGKLWK
jgi:predicted phosphodiesterase